MPRTTLFREVGASRLSTTLFRDVLQEADKSCHRLYCILAQEIPRLGIRGCPQRGCLAIDDSLADEIQNLIQRDGSWRLSTTLFREVQQEAKCLHHLIQRGGDDSIYHHLIQRGDTRGLHWLPSIVLYTRPGDASTGHSGMPPKEVFGNR